MLFSLKQEECRVEGDRGPWIRDCGNKGHRDISPYAVPKSHLCGIVTHIHWPPQQWRIFD